MTIELYTGSGDGPPIEEGATVPNSQTAPNVNPDEVLASLDADTRAFLKLLLADGAKALGDRGEEFSAVLRRFEPTVRDIAKFQGALASRRKNLEQVIHDFGSLVEELGMRDDQLKRFVNSSNAVLGSFANQEAAIRGRCASSPRRSRRRRRRWPAPRSSPTSSGPPPALIPAAQALAPALRRSGRSSARRSTRSANQIRPATREIGEPIRTSTAAKGLADSTPALSSSFEDLNILFNEIAYNPPGAQEEGFLFWIAWLNHNTNAVSTLQDANGPLLRGIVMITCGNTASPSRWRTSALPAPALRHADPDAGDLPVEPALPRRSRRAPAQPDRARATDRGTTEPLRTESAPRAPGVRSLPDEAGEPATRRSRRGVRRPMQKTGPDTRTDLHRDRLRALVLRPAALPLARLRRPGAAGPEGYRVTVPFQEATQLAVESDVRISGVPVGKVKASTSAPTRTRPRRRHARDRFRVRADPERHPGHPAPEDAARRDLRRAHSGRGGARTIAEGGELPEAQVSESVQLDEIFRSFNEETRADFQTWMQDQSLSVIGGRGYDLNAALGNLDPFAEETNDVLRVLDSQRLATRQLVRDTGEVFDALSERQGQLRGPDREHRHGLLDHREPRHRARADVHDPAHVPRGVRLTLDRLDRFAADTDPLVQQLRPAARELSPTLIALGKAAPAWSASSTASAR